LYLLPLCAPLTLAAARILRQTRTRRFLAIAGTASLLLMVGAKAGSAWVPHKNNMEQLAAVVGPVREQTGSNAAVLAFRQTRLFGLEFYLRDIICRVSDIPKASAYPVEISDFGACAGALDEASVIVLLKRDLDELLAAAARANVAFEQVDATPSWIVGVLSPTAPASDQ
jgi:hypothetical protein